jgi:hypothetical protein
MTARDFLRSRGFLAISILGAAIVFYFLIFDKENNKEKSDNFKLAITDSAEYIHATLAQYYNSNTSVLEKVDYGNGIAKIVFTDMQGHDYFANNNRIKEILSLESFKYFYKLPFLKEIDYVFELPAGDQQYKVKRDKLETLFGVKLKDIRECRATTIYLGDKWMNAMKDYAFNSERIDYIYEQLNK